MNLTTILPYDRASQPAGTSVIYRLEEIWWGTLPVTPPVALAAVPANPDFVNYLVVRRLSEADVTALGVSVTKFKPPVPGVAYLGVAGGVPGAHYVITVGEDKTFRLAITAALGDDTSAV